ncbi:MAG TPA: hypothetical protein DEQ30_07330 [Porphyromonadaceae bacterium]|nr:hypothetical protein [Porphyromonadaceae bacterium]
MYHSVLFLLINHHTNIAYFWNKTILEADFYLQARKFAFVKTNEFVLNFSRLALSLKSERNNIKNLDNERICF